MNWIGVIHYQDKIDYIGGEDTNNDTNLNHKIKKYVKQGCQKVEVYHNDQTIYPAGIKQIKERSVPYEKNNVINST